MGANGHLWALVLAGGDGARLQPLTRLIAGAPIPKQYCRILGDRSLLEMTLDRVAPVVSRERTLAIVTRAHLPLARLQLSGLPVSNVLVQPRNLDTGPGIALSLLALAHRAPAATVVVLPSDHDVRDEPAFRRHVMAMADLATRRPEDLVLLGVRPDRVEQGYGYIAPGRVLPGAADAFRVVAFHEKPTPAVAARIIGRGGLWNAFVMAGRVGRFLELLREVRPDEMAPLERLAADRDAPDEAYAGLRPWNFSRDFLMRIPRHLIVARADDVGWSDWGTAEAIERTLAGRGPVLAGATASDGLAACRCNLAPPTRIAAT